jgi:hypothetical protein
MQSNHGRRQSFSSQMGATNVPPPANGRPSMQSQRTHSGTPGLNLNGLHHQPTNPHDGPPRLGPSPHLRSSPKISHDGSSIHSDSYKTSSNTHLPPRESRSSPILASQTHAKEPGMASPQTRSTSAQQLPIRRPSTINPALERVFTPLMELIQLHSKKMYGASPPEVEMIFARTPQGGQPKQGTPGSPRNDWDEVWMQLSGTSLSVWSMRETKEADKRGERVPPTYYNVTGKSGLWNMNFECVDLRSARDVSRFVSGIAGTTTSASSPSRISSTPIRILPEYGRVQPNPPLVP